MGKPANRQAKTYLVAALCVVLCLALVGVGLWVYSGFVGRRVEEKIASIGSISDKLKAFTYSNRNDSVESFAFRLPSARVVQLHTWQMNLLGNVSVSIAAADGTVIFQEALDTSSKTFQVFLEEGTYTVITHFSGAFAGGCVVGVDYQRYYLEQLPILLDTDLDGLLDEEEGELGTDPELADTDGDSLTDYAEVVKYGTDPLEEDSDGDGVADSAWDERREYAYSVHTRILIREPFIIETMTDTYQDVRVVAGPDENGYTEIEAILYPDVQVPIAVSSYPLTDLADDIAIYTEPGIATNYDAQMQAEVQTIVGDAETDVQVTLRILSWVRSETTYHLDYSLPEFVYTYVEAGEVEVRNYDDPFPVDDMLRTHYYADSMFAERTHGTCTSVATLKCAMLKAAGIPCRLIQTVPLVYSHGSQTVPYANNLTREWSTEWEQPPGRDVEGVNHAFLEVYLGGQWLRVDNTIGIYYHSTDELSLKILSVADWSEVDFTETWPVDWIHERPFYTLVIEDQEPEH
jgi:transglutaminase-like putative cysteine protease